MRVPIGRRPLPRCMDRQAPASRIWLPHGQSAQMRESSKPMRSTKRALHSCCHDCVVENVDARAPDSARDALLFALLERAAPLLLTAANRRRNGSDSFPISCRATARCWPSRSGQPDDALLGAGAQAVRGPAVQRAGSVVDADDPLAGTLAGCDPGFRRARGRQGAWRKNGR